MGGWGCTTGRSGPDCAVGPRSGRDCAVTRSLLYKAASSATPAVRMVPGRSARILGGCGAVGDIARAFAFFLSFFFWGGGRGRWLIEGTHFAAVSKSREKTSSKVGGSTRKQTLFMERPRTLMYLCTPHGFPSPSPDKVHTAKSKSTAVLQIGSVSEGFLYESSVFIALPGQVGEWVSVPSATPLAGGSLRLTAAHV